MLDIYLEESDVLGIPGSKSPCNRSPLSSRCKQKIDIGECPAGYEGDGEDEVCVVLPRLKKLTQIERRGISQQIVALKINYCGGLAAKSLKKISA